MTAATDTVSIEAFRADAEKFLSGRLERPREERSEWGQGSDRVGLLDEKTPEEELAEVEAAKAWRQELFDAGFGWITGPPAYGGGGLTPAHDRAYREVESGFRTPSAAPFAIGLGMVAPTILAHAIEEVRQA